MPAPDTRIAPQPRPDIRLQLSPGLERSLAVLRMSGADLRTALAREQERNPFLLARLPGPPLAGGDPGEDVAEPVTWRRHLADQCWRSGWPEHTAALAEAVVHLLDDDGYLALGDREIAGLEPFRGASVRAIRDARDRIGTLHPAGLGTPDLRTRLLAQLAELRRGDPAAGALRQAGDILENHFDALARQEIGALPPDRLDEALGVIRALDPCPTDSFGGAIDAQSPDIVVRKSRTLWRALPGPGLDIGADTAAPPRDVGAPWDPATRPEIARLWRDASGLARSVDYRRRRLLEVAQVAVDLQRDFWERGAPALRPLRLADIARETGASVTTVSLTVRGKTFTSPRGFHALKYLLPRAFAGAGVPRTSVLEAIRKAIADEDPRAPMTDRMLAESAPGLGGASRRTVALMRTELGIPPSHARRPPRRKGAPAAAGRGDARTAPPGG